MTDRDRFELDMSPGMQPQSGLGDRVLAGLAVAVLIGGAVIAVGNLLPDPDEVANASGEPSSGPSRTPRPSPTPIPPRVAALVEPDIEIAPPPPYAGFDGWIRVLRDLPIRRGPGLEAEAMGVLTTDSIALASTQPVPPDGLSWLFLPEHAGWIASRIGGVEVVRRYEYPRYRYSGWVNGLTAGPDGFVAILSPPGGPEVYEPSRPATSANGATWQSADPGAFASWGVNGLAWGPAGWLAAGYVSDDVTARIWIWGSPDGLAWTRLGMLDGVEGEFITQLVASDRGYLMETYPQGGGTFPYGTLWSSLDGLVWRESTDPLLGHALYGGRRIVALPVGFYMWDAGTNPLGGSLFAAFSEDGLSWNEVANGPDGANLQLTEYEGGLVAIGLDGETLAPRVWSGVVQDRQVSWIRETASEATFAGAVVRQVVADGTDLFAVGWDRATNEPLVWTGDGVRWVRGSLPDSFGGVPLMVAAGPGGTVVVGSRHSLRGDNPIFWRRSASGAWLAEPDPILDAVPDPQAEDCPPPPDEVLEYSVVDAAAMVSCYGAASITFRAYSAGCEGCEGSMEGNPEPAWLLDPGGNQLWLSPDDTHVDYSISAVLGPSLIPPDPAWTKTWVEITGHYDDPASATCHREPSPDEIGYWYGQQSVIDQCRMTFVVTKVTVLSGP